MVTVRRAAAGRCWVSFAVHEEGREEKERAAVCDRCRGYVKTVFTLSALTPMELLVADVITLPLDLIAGERGYGC
jgi:hypothetical protein